MTGDQLITRLRVGDFLRLAHRAGKVHRAYIDHVIGEPIDRKKLASATKNSNAGNSARKKK